MKLTDHKSLDAVGKGRKRTTLEVPASSELFITASESGGIQVTNTKPQASTGP